MIGNLSDSQVLGVVLLIAVVVLAAGSIRRDPPWHWWK